MEGGVKVDKWGYEVRTSSDACISAIDDFYDQVLSYGRHRSVILEAPSHDKDCVLANILAAHFLCSSDPSRAPSHLQAAKSRLEQATQYEKAVFDAVNCLISDNRDDDVALELHSKLLKSFPKDLVSLKRAQVLCFYMARPDLSLDLVQQVLPNNEQENYIYGMLSFPLLELGRMTEAEKAAKKGYEINKQDCWVHHNLCHVLQYDCRFKEAVEFMKECSSSWDSCSSFMVTHNWWHVALCYLEGHSPIQTVLNVYDHCIWKELEKPDAASPEVYLNALGLLLRVHVRGEIDAFEDRLKTLANCVTDQANWYLEWHLDVLILWALANTGEISKAEDLLKGLTSRIAKMKKKKQQLMQRPIQVYSDCDLFSNFYIGIIIYSLVHCFCIASSKGTFICALVTSHYLLNLPHMGTQALNFL
ncbi:PREDICTED: tetratricopeptide [Prunus dulcis]|uniref:Tetratricopeptide repeat protein 38 n=1 Tax=Prunus dulcis TaxID=3755 RepID=A0A5E4FMU3_PRUDU|nr:PREDICTED: tetratricopeptide [Prunus dulcis]